MNLKTLHNLFRGHKEGTWVMQFENCVALYKFIKEHDIKRVLDLGTGLGLSASIIGLALNEKGVDYHIDSIEQFDKCVDLAKKLIPEELQKNLTIHKSNAVVWQDPKTPVVNYSVYETIPEGDYDLIINDGPSFWAEGDYLVDLQNGTITKMLLEGRLRGGIDNLPHDWKEKGIDPGTFVIWDGRLSMLSLLERYYSENFELYRPANKDDMNILRRLDNEPKFQDEKLRALLETTTFFNEEKTISATDGTSAKSENETPFSGTGQTI